MKDISLLKMELSIMELILKILFWILRNEKWKEKLKKEWSKCINELKLIL
jgi:hypothetical protein